MRISVKGRYALATIIIIAEKSLQEENVSVAFIAEQLEISKIYLEQVFSTLKKADLLTSIKGPHGGYKLARPASDITIYDVLSTLELGITERTESTVADSAPAIEMTLKDKVFNPLDRAVVDLLTNITVQSLLDEKQFQLESQSYMINM
ncbi:MAG: Rrf2 family transcriptional regulator [Clostridiales Family XIII bacterium]|jgi:Rrf2 family protein|nr:Rrf2 family transcriptional regulator [Clostridiales Family XIII bacterium]